MRLLFLALLLSFNYVNILSQATFEIHITQPKDSILIELQTKNTELYSILDSIIAYEPKCKYYSEGLFYMIILNKEFDHKKNSFISMQITSENKMAMITTFNNKGYFYYKNKLFIVSGNACSEVFILTSNTYKFPFEPYDIYIDDSFSTWIYRYIDKKFILEGYCRCNDKKATYLIPPTKGEKIVY